jgi:hypothetical protein
MAFKVGTSTVINGARNFTVTGASGRYDDLRAEVATITTVLNFNTPMMSVVLGSSTTFTESNKELGKIATLLLDRSASGHTPTFSANVQWANDSVPSWSTYRYWTISFVCWDSTIVRAVASGRN